MEIAKGVQLHLIKTKQFKSNHIRFRFSGNFDKKTVAKRVLVAQMLVTANATYPTAQKFRAKLANSYGASVSTNVSTIGKVHIVDIDLSFIQDNLAPRGEKVLEEMIDFLHDMLFKPLVSVAQYQTKTFDLEKGNLIHYLEANREDAFYSSSLTLKSMFYNDSDLQESKYGQVELLKRETAYTAYQEFQKMLTGDQLDIFILGDFDDYRMIQLFNKFPLEDRKKKLTFNYDQRHQRIIKKRIARKDTNQSVLQLGYHFFFPTNERFYAILLVTNGLLGAFSHSQLFTEIREKEGLAYSIASQFDWPTGFFNIYAGIDKKNLIKTVRLINKQLTAIKLGKISPELLNQTKKMLITNIRLSKDNPKSWMDEVYHETYISPGHNRNSLIESINYVYKDDVSLIAKYIRLQAIYFWEGN